MQNKTDYILITGNAAPKYLGEVGKITTERGHAAFPLVTDSLHTFFMGSSFVYITKEQYESEAFRKTMKAFYGTPQEE